MAFITFYGQPTSAYQYIKSKVLKELLEKGHKCTYREVQDVDQIITDCIKIPSVGLNKLMQIEYPGSGLDVYVEKVSNLLDHTIRKMITDLVVPIDYSAASEQAVLLALNLAKKHGLSVTFVHVYYPDASIAESSIQVADQIESNERQRFQQWMDAKKQLYNDLDVPINCRFEIGFPAQTICQIAKNISNSIIIMARNNDDKVLKKLLGSVSTYVMKHAEAPVMIVPPAYQVQDFKRVCFAYETFSVDTKEINEILSFAIQADTDLDILHVHKHDAGVDQSDIMRKAGEIIHHQRLAVHQRANNSVENGILEHIEAGNVDLLIMLKTQKNFIQNWFNKSHTKSILSKLDIPILVYHEYA